MAWFGTNGYHLLFGLVIILLYSCTRYLYSILFISKKEGEKFKWPGLLKKEPDEDGGAEKRKKQEQKENEQHWQNLEIPSWFR